MPLTFRSNEVKLKDDVFVNIETGRTISKLDRKDFKYIIVGKTYINEQFPLGSKEYKLCGEMAKMWEFIQENNLVDVPGTTAPNYLKPTIKDNEEKTTIPLPAKSNPFDIDATSLSSLQRFIPADCKGKGLITRVVDGDTFDLVVYLDLKELTTTRTKTSRGKQQIVVYAYGVGTGGIYTKLRCRLSGIDTAEKNTERGKTAKTITDDILKKYDYIVYYHILPIYEKYGRTLVELYLDSSFNDSLKSRLLNYNSDACIALNYDGGTKRDFKLYDNTLRKAPVADKVGLGSSCIFVEKEDEIDED